MLHVVERAVGVAGAVAVGDGGRGALTLTLRAGVWGDGVLLTWHGTLALTVRAALITGWELSGRTLLTARATLTLAPASASSSTWAN